MVSGESCPIKFSPDFSCSRDTAAGDWTPRDPVGDYWVTPNTSNTTGTNKYQLPKPLPRLPGSEAFGLNGDIKWVRDRATIETPGFEAIRASLMCDADHAS